MIVQELHHIQQEFGYLPREQLLALERRLNAGADDKEQVKLYQLHQVATYFPHFRLTPPPRVRVDVCRDMACHMQGAGELCDRLRSMAQEMAGSDVAVNYVSCLGQCDAPVALAVNDHVYRGKILNDVRTLIELALRGERLPHPNASRAPLPAEWLIDPYNGAPIYEHVRKFIDQFTADLSDDREAKRTRIGGELLDRLKTANLRGMGGAGVPADQKWRLVASSKNNPKYVVCNGDESEPGTFKDREILRRAPHLIIEGMTLAALLTGAERGWIFIRHEYQEEIAAVEAALVAAREMGACGERMFGSSLRFDLQLYESPGGYICGEETALIEVLEDHRAEPRNKPPGPAEIGYLGLPTVLNNVETFGWIPAILKHDEPAWYGGAGGAAGLRLVSISGDVARPGVYMARFGETAGQIIQRAGGMSGGRKFKAMAPSGPSGGFLPAQLPVAKLGKKAIEQLTTRNLLTASAPSVDLLNVPLEIDLMRDLGGGLGAAMIVYGDDRNMADQALNCTEFFQRESCGKCVPCRIGSQKLVEMLREAVRRQTTLDRELVEEMGLAISETSICGLGQVVASPIRSILRFFPEDLNELLNESKTGEPAPQDSTKPVLSS